MRKLILFTFLTATLCACMMGPNYKRPQVDTPQKWRFEDQEAKQVANTRWWEQFGDTVLNDLIQSALSENKTVMIAAARVEQFAGLYGTTRAQLFPQIGAAASAGRERISEKAGPSGFQGNPNFSNYEIFLTGVWEIDFWGKLRRAKEAARANLLSTEEARKSVILTLVSSVATSYINLRALDRELELTKQATENYKATFDLFTLRFQHGIVSEIEVSQAKSQYQEAAANIPVFEKIIAQQENALCVLLGRNPGPIPRGKTIDQLILPSVPAGVPSEILTNRPDIRQAEQDLIAANANIGVAKALYFPTISLTGFYGWASSDLSHLFNGPARTWSWAVPVSAPIFTGGAISGQVKSAEAVKQQALVNYGRTIQDAFREVEDSLIDQKRTKEQLASQNEEVMALRDYARLARLRYDNGYTSYLEVLYSESRLYDTELVQTQTMGALLQALINVYKAMGGGWVVEADKMTMPPGPAGQMSAPPSDKNVGTSQPVSKEKK